MQLSGNQSLAHAPAVVWAGLNDPDLLRACIPGCESLDPAADGEYAVVVLSAVGPFKARFSGRLRLSDVRPLQGYTLTFDANGGAVGFGKGSAEVQLSATGDGTLLEYATAAEVGGKLAQIGSRLVLAAAKKTADDFFARFRAELDARRPPAGTVMEEPSPRATAPMGTAFSETPGPQTKPAPSARRWLYGAGAVLLLLLAWLAARATS
ncbi:MAG: hypothetical protein K0R89_2356 [Ramlibacter sp.]|jgi:carbon monoxide dehydrogenase subunit G|nr:hypothetical protein [Ramlibacter sp.]